MSHALLDPCKPPHFAAIVMGVGKALAEYTAAEAAPRFHALCSSTFSMLQERTRLAREIATSHASATSFHTSFPFFGRDKMIDQNLHILLQALDTWDAMCRSGDLLESENVPRQDRLEEWTGTVRELVAMLRNVNNLVNDPHGCAMANAFESRYESILKEPVEAPQFEQEPAVPYDDLTGYIDALPSASNAPVPHYDGDQAAALAAQAWKFSEQDAHLDRLGASISRQHTLSIQMNDELEMHAGLLHELNEDAESTGLRLGSAGSRLNQFREQAGGNGA